jgi:hypothetical protein
VHLTDRQAGASDGNSRRRADTPDKLSDSLSNVSRAGGIDRASRPVEAVKRRRPNPENRLPSGQAEPEHRRKARMRRTYDVNKELADDLRAGYTVVIGSTTIWTPSGQVIRKEKKGSRNPSPFRTLLSARRPRLAPIVFQEP